MDTPKYHLKYGEVSSIGREISDKGLIMLNLAYDKLDYRWKILLQSSKHDYLAVKIIVPAIENLNKNKGRPGSNPPSYSQTKENLREDRAIPGSNPPSYSQTKKNLREDRAIPDSNPPSNYQTTTGNRPVNSNNEFYIQKFNDVF